MGSAMRNHIDALDGIRAFACFLVILSHGTRYFPSAPDWMRSFYSSGHFGVMLFFVLSGFLMGYLYLGKDFSTDNAISYISARFARIAPIYIVSIILVFVLSRTTSDFVLNPTNFDVVRLLLFVGSYDIFWSISPEIQFYFFFMIIWAAASLARNKGDYNSTYVCSIVILSCILFSPIAPGISLPSKLIFFITGVGASYLRKSMVGKVSIEVATAIQIISALLFLIAINPEIHRLISPHIAQIPDAKMSVFYGDIRYALLSGVVVFAFSFGTNFSSAVLGNSFAKMLGRYSFSLYLLHMIVFYYSVQIGELLDLDPRNFVWVGIILLLPTGWIAYRLIEAPCRDILKTQIPVWIRSIRSRMDLGQSSPQKKLNEGTRLDDNL